MRALLKKTAASILAALMVFALLPARAALAADTEPVIALGDATYSGGKYSYAGATVSGTGIQTVLLNFSDTITAGEAITLPEPSPSGFTVSTTSNNYNKRIRIDTTVTGTDNAAAVQDYIRQIGFTITGTTQTVQVVLTTADIQYDTFYNNDNQHYYQYIPDTSSSWTAAYDSAKGMTYMGRTGYLATIANLDEDKYVSELSGGNTGWLGGTILNNSGSKTDASGGTSGSKLYYSSFDTTGVVSTGWYWACGPEIGTTFYNVNSLYPSPDSTTAGEKDGLNAAAYYNWARGTVSFEPNNQTAYVDSTSGDYETCLTTLVIANNSGKHNTSFSWNDKHYDTAGTGEWNAKGYFVEYGDSTQGDSKTGAAVTGYASAKGTLHAASTAALTVNLYLNGALANIGVPVTLRKDGSTVATGSSTAAGLYTFAADALNSETYGIYIGGVDTGKSFTYAGTTGSSLDVDCYTVTYSVSDAGTASGSGISAAAGGTSISNGYAVPAGTTVVITAAGAGASSYAYAWSGNGTSGVTTAALTIPSLSGLVNVSCVVTGVGVNMTLNSPVFSTDTSYSFPALTLTSSSDIGVVTINTDKAASSGETIALPADGDTPGGVPTVITDLNKLTKTVVFASVQSAASVQAYLRAVTFTAPLPQAQSVTITADANTTTGLSSGMKLTAFTSHPDGTTHYYAYVGSSPVTWISAYNTAKTMKFMGMTGYLPTITSPQENAVLTNISTNGAWSAGTRLLKDGTTDKITDSAALSAGDYDAHSEASDFYWACGPEAGLVYSYGKKYNDPGFGLADSGSSSAFETAFSSSPWGAAQPDNYGYGIGTTEPCMQVNYPDGGSYKWNDLPVICSTNDKIQYYFVEFGGYTGSTGLIKQIANDPGNPTALLRASASSTVTATYAITYNLDGGANPVGAPASYAYGTGALLPVPTKAGFAFGGWYAASDLSGSAATAISPTDSGEKTYWAKWTQVASYGGDLPAKTIAVTEISSALFAGSMGAVLAEANVDNAFSNSVEVKVTDTGEDTSSFGFGAGADVYPFDISLYIKGTNTRTEPASGYAVTISLPIPESLLDVREKLIIAHRSASGAVTPLTSSLKQIGGVWYLVFDATEFSPYALVVSNLTSYDTSAGLPYYYNGSASKVFIGFAADGKYLAPERETVLLSPNPKSFTDISSHWGKTSVDFVTEREIFVGTGTNIFSPDTGMTRAMLATAIGRLYERSFGPLTTAGTHVFTDCDYTAWYGSYIDWCAENGIVTGVGGGSFEPDRQVTRQEMAVMLYRFAQYMKLDTREASMEPSDFPDTVSIASWAQTASAYCKKTGIITGREGGMFAPGETATRAEVAAIFERFIQLVV
jgi:uncharacterized repeat protein (TIGR02543 family)